MTKQPIIRKYIDPMVDYGFKKIFKESGNKQLIIKPLNVIFGLLNFNLRHLTPEQAEPDQYIHLFTLRDEKTSELMTDRLRFAFLEVKRFCKKKEECHTFEDRFLFMMKNLPTFAEKPELWDDDPYFEEMLAEAESANMTDKQLFAYMESLMRKWDDQNALDYAKEEARAEGRAEGREEGREEGRMEGREEERINTAREMLKDSVPIETIVKYTHLSEEQVRAL